MKRGPRPSAEHVLLILCQIEVQPAQNKSTVVACKETYVLEQKLYDECLRQEIFDTLK